MPDTDETLAPSADAAPAAAAPAEDAAPPAVQESRSDERMSLADVVGSAIDRVESGASTETQAEPAAPPAATEDEEDEDPASDDAQAGAAPDPAPAEKAGKEGSEAAEEGELSPAELAALPKKTQRRIQRLAQERGRFKVDADAYQNITTYMAENRLQPDEVAVGFDLMARLKRGDAEGFLKAVEPYVQQARMATGEVLPDDLRQRVDQGYVDEDTAREAARARAEAKAAREALRERDDRDRAREATVHADALRDTLNSWDRANQTDPDFTASRPALLAFAKESFAARPPKSADEAVQRLDEHWNLIRRRAPRPRPSTPSPSSTPTTGRPMVREPRSLMDAIDIGLERAYARGAAS